jgi:hypothetical protein
MHLKLPWNFMKTNVEVPGTQGIFARKPWIHRRNCVRRFSINPVSNPIPARSVPAGTHAAGCPDFAESSARICGLEREG